MRKLKLQMQTSLDGFVAAGPNDEQLWVTWAWDEIRPHVMGLLDGADTILIGRKLAVDYIPYWQGVAKQPDDPMHEGALKIVAARKVVFTKTLKECPWEGTELATGDLVEEVAKLKQQPGKDLVVYGGTSFVADLIKAGLIDEYHFFVNPVALGQGDPVFNLLDGFRQLTLQHAAVYKCGIVLLQYTSK